MNCILWNNFIPNMILFSVLFNCLVFYVVDCSNQLHRLAYNHMFFYMLVEIFLLLTIEWEYGYWLRTCGCWNQETWENGYRKRYRARCWHQGLSITKSWSGEGCRRCIYITNKFSMWIFPIMVLNCWELFPSNEVSTLTRENIDKKEKGRSFLLMSSILSHGGIWIR